MAFKKLNILSYILLILFFGIGSGNAQTSRAIEDSLREQKGVRNFPVEEYFQNIQIHSITIDSRGLVYFAQAHGIVEFDGIEWRMISVPDSAEVNALAVNSDGRIYGGGENIFGYLYVDDAGNTKFQSLVESLSSPFNDTIIEIKTFGDIVYFIGFKTIIKYSDETVEIVGRGNFLSAGFLGNTLIVSDQDHGLLYIDEIGNMTPISTKEARVIRAQKMKALSPQQLLISTRSSGFFTAQIEENALALVPWGEPRDPNLRQASISSIDVFNDKLVALGSFQDGLFLTNLEGQIVQKYSAENGLLNNYVFNVFFSQSGSLWAGLDEGTSLIKIPREFTKVNVATTVVAENFAPEDTSHSEKGFFAWIKNAYNESLGGWFSEKQNEEEKSNASLDKTADVFAAIVRKVEYTPTDSVIFGGAFSETRGGVQVLDQSDSTNFEFDYDFNAFRFSYSTNNYEDIEGLQYQVRLDGLDHSWSKLSNNTYREYTNLSWGEYVFLVRAQDVEGNLSRSASFSFSISPPWYESTWFYLLQFTALLMALVVSGILNKTGKAISLSEALIAVVVIVIFQYVDFYIDPYLDEYSDGIAVFKIGISIVFGFSLEFIEELFHKIVAKLTGLENIEPDVEDGLLESETNSIKEHNEMKISTNNN